MTKAIAQPFRQALRDLMARSGICSLEELSQRSQLSTWQLYRIQSGLIAKLSLENTVKLANALQVSISELLACLGSDNLSLAVIEQGTTPLEPAIAEQGYALENERLRQEYDRLKQQLEAQKSTLTAEFQQSTLETLESWLLQWPTAAAVAQKNPQLSAVKLLTLVKPVNDLLKRWGVEPIGRVGEMIPYDPQCHQLMEGNAEVSDRVWVRYVGYQQGDKLLYRAKVSPIAPAPEQKADDNPTVLRQPLPPVHPLPAIATALDVPTFGESEEQFHEDFIDDYPASRGTRVYYYD